MKIKKIYNNTIKNTKWNYYNKKITNPNLCDVNSCALFIKKYIKLAEKSKALLYNEIDYLRTHFPERLTHIVSTFLIGIWIYRSKRSSPFHKLISEELKRLKCFQHKQGNIDIDQQFAFVWFMIALFHDLGYKAENTENGENLPNHTIPLTINNDSNCLQSVPDFYKSIYQQYYKYRNNKEHGIYAGIIFDRDICEIRSYQECSDSKLNWSKELEELYHYVAWIILSHNIWMIRKADKEKVKIYEENHLDALILSSEKDNKGEYIDYKIKLNKHPLFSLFCVIDAIEPTKSSSCLTNIDIKLTKDKIIIDSNDSLYQDKVYSLNEWLTPVTKEGCTSFIHLNIN